MTSPDFIRIAEVAALIVKKDSKHTLIIFSGVGLAIIGYSWFNPENRLGLVVGGVFFSLVGVVRYLFERSKRPFLMLALVKKKEAIPYTRMPGTFDYYIQVESIVNYSFSLDAEFSSNSAQLDQRWKVSPDIFVALREGSQSMMLFSATRTLLGVFDIDYKFTAY